MADQDVLAKLAFTSRFLLDSLDRGLVDRTNYARLSEELARRSRLAVGAARVPATVPAPARPATPPAAPVPAPPPAVATPTRRSWVDEAWRAWGLIASDVAVHGLAYLGVLLTFVGTLGLVLFAFGGVNVALRPVAELAVPVVLFGSAWFISGRGAPFVSRSLELLGGALTPVVVFAAFADGTPVPPDPQGAALVATLVASAGGLAALYAAIARRRPDSPLRYLVAPLVWTAAGALGLVFHEGTSAAQMAAVAVAVALTTLATRVWPEHPLAGPARAVAGPGVAAAASLTVLLGIPEGLPAVPVAVAALAAIVVADLVGGVAVPMVQAAVGAAGAGVLVASLGAGPAGLAAVAAGLALLERHDLTRRAETDLLAAGGCAAFGLALATARPWTLLAAWGMAAVWAHVRLLSGRPRLELPVSVAAALLPLGAAAGLHRLAEPGAAWVLTAGAVLVAAAAALGVGEPRDRMHRWWVPAAAVFTATLALDARGLASDADLAAAAAIAGLAALVAPGPGTWRVWTSGAGFAAALAMALPAMGVPAGDRPVVWAAGAGGAVAWATLAFSRRAAPWTGHLAALGALVGAGTLAVAQTPPAWFAAVLCLTAVWLVTVVTAERDGSPLVALAGRYARIAKAGAAVVLAASVPALVVVTGDLWDAFAGRFDRIGLAVATCAVAAAVAARMVAGRRPLAPALADTSFVLAILAAAMTTGKPVATISALAASIVVVAVLGELRRRPAVWFAWAASGAIALVAAALAGLDDPAVRAVALGWGAAVAVVPRAVRRARENLAAPSVLGLAAVTLAPLAAVQGEEFAALALGGALVWIAVAGLTGLGGLAAPGWSLGAAGVAWLLPYSPVDSPVLLVGIAASLGAVAWVASRILPRDGLAQRWDLGPVVVGHALVAAALATSTGRPSMALAWTAAGALGLAAALVLRSPAFAAGGAALVVIGAAVHGTGASAVSLAAVAAGAAAASERTANAKLARQLRLFTAGSGIAAAYVAGLALGLRPAGWTLAALSGGLAATVAALALHRRDPGHRWREPLGVLSAVATAGAVRAAAAGWPRRDLLVAALATAGAEAAAGGIVLRRRTLTLAAPALLCAAWLAFATGTLSDVQWFTVPAGVALLAIVEIERRGRAGEGRATGEDLVALDWLGMGFLVAPALVQTAVAAVGYGLVAALSGTLLAAWGVTTRVRRRVTGGGVAVTLAAVLMVAVPLAELVPRVRGVALWVAIAVLGLGLIAAATSLEQGRTRVRAAVKRLGELTEGWE